MLMLGTGVLFDTAGARDALAADIRTPSRPALLHAAAYKWTGFYFGLNGGFGVGNSNRSDVVDLQNGSCTTVDNCGGAEGSIVSFEECIVRAGVNFKFGPDEVRHE